MTKSYLVIIDWQNLYMACRKLSIRLEAIVGEIHQMGLANGNLREIRLFVPCYQFSLAPWGVINALLSKYDLTVEVCPALSERISKDELVMKDSVDFRVLQWVEAHLYPGVGPDVVVFVSGDGHWLMSSNVAKRKGKEVEFWSVDSSSTHNLIRRQEKFLEVSLSPEITLTKENRFVGAMNSFLDRKPLSQDDKRRVELIARMAKRNGEETKLPIEELLTSLSSSLEISEIEAKDLLEALMATGIARVYPGTRKLAIDVDTSSPFFQFLS